MNKSLIIGLAGGTGSGKTTISEKIVEHFKNQILYIPHDRYYKDQSEKSMEDRMKTNYDHPDSLETDLFFKQLHELLEGRSINIPEYDFTIHTRNKDVTTPASPAPLILIEGILVLENEQLRNMMDLKVFVDVPADIRILRRLKRDVDERGRTVESVMAQYLETVRPMDEKFIQPSAQYADIIIPQGGYNEKGIAALISAIEKMMK